MHLLTLFEWKLGDGFAVVKASPNVELGRQVGLCTVLNSNEVALSDAWLW